ncbi:DUF3325 family protein [Polymorphobacter fuscus]|uniref:DUF3325 family protein n=1 Tax=Sandarakinorhabdus fusca TaxID=1439888 RepID=A0A7C9GQD6_9SPHN|nr:DUF3325 family protein [Polymorphobacter fuscus]KAB7648811.1 DUF3325 domain-containing protein [Polymorphobacter fuscus]MQT16391.1 DUF3325 family protein [Polymorphobacter fuscus]NJC07320.1 hypothetical protein [Polymorphobacter fuscus]
MIMLCLLAAFAGFALLGLADPEHYRRRIGPPLPRRILRLRIAGWAALAAALPLAIVAEGLVFGPIVWCGTLMLAAGCVWLGLNLLPVRQRRR